MLVNINGNTFEVKLAVTLNAIRQGMQGKRFDDTYNGLLFLMPKDDNHSFGMKNCLIPLDIIFIKDNMISTLHVNCEPCSEEICQSYTGNGSFVLEVPGGTCNRLGIKKGDRIEMKLY